MFWESCIPLCKIKTWQHSQFANNDLIMKFIASFLCVYQETLKVSETSAGDDNFVSILTLRSGKRCFLLHCCV